MSTARTGRRVPVRRIVALALVVGVLLAAGIAAVWRLAEPGDGPAAPAVHAATLPDEQEPAPGGEPAPQVAAPAATPQPVGPSSWVSRGSPSRTPNE